MLLTSGCAYVSLAQKHCVALTYLNPHVVVARPLRTHGGRFCLSAQDRPTLAWLFGEQF